MGLPADIELLRRIAAGTDTPADRIVLAGRVRAYLAAAPSGESLDDAFGLTPSPGQLPWWRAEALARRDAALRALAARFYAGEPVNGQASAIHAALIRYAASAWQRDRERSSPPASYVGSPREMMFDAMRASGIVPGVRHLRRVLGA